MNLSRLKEELHSFQNTDWMLLLVTVSLFLTQYVMAGVLILYLGWMIYKKQLWSAIKEQPGALWIYLFVFLEIIVSLFATNFTGLVNAIGMLLVVGFISGYRQQIHPKLFHYMIDIMLIGSIFVGILALFQFADFSAQKGYDFFEFHIQNSPKRRIMATFDNANLYATMLEFWIFFCVYRFIQCRGLLKRILYVVVGLFNFGLLYLTGCRTALLPLVVIIPLFFFLAREKKWLLLSLAGLGIGIILVFMEPDLIPRITDMSTLESRFNIWNCAWMGIQNYPIFGLGPQSYHLYYQMFNGHKAPHAHNIYVDSLASYGIVGTLLIIYYACRYLFPEIGNVRLYDRELFGLIIGFILIFLIHGLLDVTMNVLATALVFMMILNAGVLVKKD
ncbi:O-antigen ligase family protein [Faecalicoccus pleomorphus]|uniref:O-antigen ligase family protein n=1 Tax=Faecalicoccus pleomorphus TaxID=1323 RepID=A0A7X9RJ48_9FIRM|nr:O-antigen ligase family protein [Faecalicoccus pleomorphus]NME44723.1 O-antigen ligase family protein [Faecalicoccus pleomorphus]